MEIEVSGGRGGGCGCVGCITSTFGLGLGLLITVGVFWAVEQSHVESDAAAIRAIEQCAAVTAALGTPIERVAYSPGCGEYSSGGGHAAASFTIQVKGPKDSGSLTYMAAQTGGPWTVHGATVSTSSGSIVAVPCVAGGVE